MGTVPVGGAVPAGAPGQYQFAVIGQNVEGFSGVATSTYGVLTPPTCSSSVSFQLVHVTGCVTHQINGDYTATTPIHLNGITFDPTPGHPITITPGTGTGTHPGGFISSRGVQLTLGGQTLYSGAISFALPAGRPGDRGHAVDLASNPISVFGFGAVGNFGLSLGRDSSGAPYSAFTLTFSLPRVLKAADGATAATGTGTLRADDNGTVDYNATTITARNLSVGSLAVASV